MISRVAFGAWGLEFRGVGIAVKGLELDMVPAQQQLSNVEQHVYCKNRLNPEYGCCCTLLLGGGSTQGLE